MKVFLVVYNRFDASSCFLMKKKRCRKREEKEKKYDKKKSSLFYYAVLTLCLLLAQVYIYRCLFVLYGERIERERVDKKNRGSM
jgi:hypothetical protein